MGLAMLGDLGGGKGGAVAAGSVLSIVPAGPRPMASVYVDLAARMTATQRPQSLSVVFPEACTTKSKVIYSTDNRLPQASHAKLASAFRLIPAARIHHSFRGHKKLNLVGT